MKLDEYFEEFRQQLQIDARTHGTFQRNTFLDIISEQLIEAGDFHGFEHCHYRRSGRGGMKIDGYFFHQGETTLDLHLADFENRQTLEPLNKRDYESEFKQARSFFIKSKSRQDPLYLDFDETSPEYQLSRRIYDQKDQIRRVNFILSSERYLSTRSKSIDNQDLSGVTAVYSIWDISRLHRQHSSRSGRVPLDVNLIDMFQRGLPCLRAHVGLNAFKSYLAVISGETLADLYEEYGARLLEQNVRCFLQARGNVNKGIRNTILIEPHRFFAYNNGITATAQDIRLNEDKSRIIRIRDLQIVNGGQTMVSLYHASQLKNAPDLSKVFVQMKISEISDNLGPEIIQKIAKYANTQNKVSIPDLRSNHPFHIKIENFSRRIWTPAVEGELNQTKWFYERSRGQYADKQSMLSYAEKKRFKAKYPKKFTKTDLAKFENVWDDAPHWVNLGAQKNFIQYMQRIEEAWKQSPEQFNEDYYQRIIARGIVFKATERMVSRQDWYRNRGGYRANIVAYTLSAANALGNNRDMILSYRKIWKEQIVNDSFVSQLALIAKFARNILYLDARPVQNPSEWAKKENFWTRLERDLPAIDRQLTGDFWSYFTPSKEEASLRT